MAKKRFTEGLESLFEEAFEEQVRQRQGGAEAAEAGRDTDAPTATEAPLSGLDALIRSTLEPASVRIEPGARRRLVVSFNEDQLAKLRTIAKMERTRLKKIINTLVEGYIEAYEAEKGGLD